MSYVLAKVESKQKLMLSARAGMWDLTADKNEAVCFFNARSAAQFQSTNSGLKDFSVEFRDDVNGN